MKSIVFLSCAVLLGIGVAVGVVSAQPATVYGPSQYQFTAHFPSPPRIAITNVGTTVAMEYESKSDNAIQVVLLMIGRGKPATAHQTLLAEATLCRELAPCAGWVGNAPTSDARSCGRTAVRAAVLHVNGTRARLTYNAAGCGSAYGTLTGQRGVVKWFVGSSDRRSGIDVELFLRSFRMIGQK